MRRRTTGLSLLALAMAASGCSRPANAGYAGADEFEAWARAHPSAEYDVVRVTGVNPVPFSGTLEIVVSADGSGPLEQRMSDAARAVCEFEPKTEGVTIDGISFREQQLTVPLACPRDGVAQWVFRVEAQAELLDELGTVRGIVSLDWRPDSLGGTFDFGSRRVADSQRVERRIEAIVAAHPRAFAEGAEVSAYAGGGITE